jgi:hypothetical protein
MAAIRETSKTNMNNACKHRLWGLSAAVLTFLIPRAASAQTTTFGYTGTETTFTLGPGSYDITAYGALGGGSSVGLGEAGGLGAEMQAQFYFVSRSFQKETN